MKKLNKRIVVPITVIIAALVVLVAGFFIFKNKIGSNTSGKREIEYLSVDEALQKQSNALENKYDNLTLPKSIETIDGNKLYIITSKLSDSVTQENKEDFVMLMGDFTGKSYEVSQIDDEFKVQMDLYDDEYIGSYTSLGSFDLTKKTTATARITNRTGQETVINANNADLNASYNIGGEEYNLSEALELSDKFLDEKISKYLKGDESYMLNYIQVCETYGEKEIHYTDQIGNDYIYDAQMDNTVPEGVALPEKTNYYCFIYALTVDGVPVSVNTDFSDENEKGYMRGSYLAVTISKKGEVGSVSLNRYFDSTNKEPVNQKIISLDSALWMASDYLAGYRKYEVSQSGLSYCCVTKYGEEEITYRPMWRIVLEEKAFGDNGPAMWEVCVDALNGNIYFSETNSGIIGFKNINSD